MPHLGGNIFLHVLLSSVLCGRGTDARRKRHDTRSAHAPFLKRGESMLATLLIQILHLGHFTTDLMVGILPQRMTLLMVKMQEVTQFIV